MTVEKEHVAGVKTLLLTQVGILLALNAGNQSPAPKQERGTRCQAIFVSVMDF